MTRITADVSANHTYALFIIIGSRNLVLADVRRVTIHARKGFTGTVNGVRAFADRLTVLVNSCIPFLMPSLANADVSKILNRLAQRDNISTQ